MALEAALDSAEVVHKAAAVEERDVVEDRSAVWSAGRRNWVANRKGDSRNREKVV